MLAKMESPTRKKMKMAEKNEIEEDEDIADNRNWIDSEIWTLLEVMEVIGYQRFCRKNREYHPVQASSPYKILELFSGP